MEGGRLGDTLSGCFATIALLIVIGGVVVVFLRGTVNFAHEVVIPEGQKMVESLDDTPPRQAFLKGYALGALTGQAGVKAVAGALPGPAGQVGGEAVGLLFSATNTVVGQVVGLAIKWLFLPLILLWSAIKWVRRLE